VIFIILNLQVVCLGKGININIKGGNVALEGSLKKRTVKVVNYILLMLGTGPLGQHHKYHGEDIND